MTLKTSQKKVLVALSTIILAFISMALYGEVKSLESRILYQYEYVPHIDLSNISYKYNDVFYVSSSGFVAFENLSDQPKQLHQYYEFETTTEIDRYLKATPVYKLNEIVKLGNLPPKQIGEPIELSVVNENDITLMLQDEAGNNYTVHKHSGNISMHDTTGDRSYLITSNTEYQEFMKNFLDQ